MGRQLRVFYKIIKTVFDQELYKNNKYKTEVRWSQDKQAGILQKIQLWSMRGFSKQSSYRQSTSRSAALLFINQRDNPSILKDHITRGCLFLEQYFAFCHRNKPLSMDHPPFKRTFQSAFRVVCYPGFYFVKENLREMSHVHVSWSVSPPNMVCTKPTENISCS